YWRRKNDYICIYISYNFNSNFHSFPINKTKKYLPNFFNCSTCSFKRRNENNTCHGFVGLYIRFKTDSAENPPTYSSNFIKEDPLMFEHFVAYLFKEE